MDKINESDTRMKIGVVGGGAWGTALANLLATKGFDVDLWVFEKEVRDQILKTRENKIFLPGIELSRGVHPTNEIGRCVGDKNLVVLVVPSHLMRDITLKIAADLSKEAIIVTASKGIENRTHLTMTGVLQETLPQIPRGRLVALSGPSFAREVAKNLPTVVTVACGNIETAAFVQQAFATPNFRVYSSQDVIGVELGGSLKNVIAIGAGVVDGLKLGLNARAALITRGMTEIRRLGIKLGANPRTFTGLAGIGDLILTCTGHLSRNHTVGVKIGQGQKVADILAEMRTVAEGIKTARSVYNLSRELGVNMPIFNEAYCILHEDCPPKEAIYRLMTRDLKEELDED